MNEVIIATGEEQFISTEMMEELTIVVEPPDLGEVTKYLYN